MKNINNEAEKQFKNHTLKIYSHNSRVFFVQSSMYKSNILKVLHLKKASFPQECFFSIFNSEEQTITI